MDNQKSVPQIRFKGFSDEWEKREFSEITFPAGEKNRNNLPYESFSITNEDGFVPQDVKFENGGTMRDADKSMYLIVSPNSFAYNPARINVGSIGYQNLSKKVIVSSLYEVFSTTSDVDDRLLWHWFKSDNFQQLIEQLQEGGVRLYFYYDKLCQGHLSLPMIKEQRIIGCFLDLIDRLISLHQRKLEQLKRIKKSMLEKMFPKEGSDVPEVRFAGFTEPWNRGSFSVVFTTLQNNTLSRADLSNNCVGAKNIHYGDILIKFSNCLDIGKETLPTINDEEIDKKYKASSLQNGDVVIADTAEDETVGKCTEIVGLRDEKVYAGLHTIPCRPLQFFSSGYLGYYMNSDSYHNQLIPLMQGTKVTSISKSALQTTTILYPADYQEQRKIGEFFRSLDGLINLQNSKLEKLRQLKQAFLAKMFAVGG